MTVNDTTVEVKTQVPWFSNRWLSFKTTQEKKMREVYLLLVVGYNHTSQSRFDWANKIWKIKKDFKIVKKYRNKQHNKEMFAISIDDPAVSVWCDTPQEVVKQLAIYSCSDFI